MSLARAGQGAGEEPVGEARDPVALAPFEAGARDFSSVEALLARWAEARPEEARLVELSRRDDGRPVHALEIRGESDVPVAERPTVLLLGGLDGVSLAGGEAVLAAAHALLADPAARPADVVFVALPWAAPEALERTRRAGWSDGRDGTPVDEDGDGAVDEDGPDDVDGDGLALAMLVEDAEGPWVLGEDRRFLVRARPGDSPRYVLTREGRDDDGDGRFNEDPPGGLVLDRNFPRASGGGKDAGPDALRGSLPLSDRTARALADLAVERRTVAALVFQGDHGGVGLPRALVQALRAGDDELAVDAPSFEAAARAWFEARGTAPRFRAAGSARGSAVDWLYESLGVLALELAPWGVAPEAPAEPVDPAPSLAALAAAAAEPPATPYAHDPAWARWNDDRRGGLDFRDWVLVDLGGGRTALVGGWEPHARLNPPEEELAARAGGGAEAALAVAHALPRLGLRLVENRRQGDLVVLSVRASNAGGLPTGLWPSERWRSADEPCGVELVLALPPGAELLAGRERTCLGRLLGGQSSAAVDWVLLLPPGDRVELRARGPWAAPCALEVHP